MITGIRYKKLHNSWKEERKKKLKNQLKHYEKKKKKQVKQEKRI